MADTYVHDERPQPIALIATWSLRLWDLIETTSFWIAVIIPFWYLPLLAFDRIIPASTLIFLWLVILNFVTLALGHDYNPAHSLK